MFSPSFVAPAGSGPNNNVSVGLGHVLLDFDERISFLTLNFFFFRDLAQNILIANQDTSTNLVFEVWNGATRLGSLVVNNYWAAAANKFVRMCATIDGTVSQGHERIGRAGTEIDRFLPPFSKYSR